MMNSIYLQNRLIDPFVEISMASGPAAEKYYSYKAKAWNLGEKKLAKAYQLLGTDNEILIFLSNRFCFE